MTAAEPARGSKRRSFLSLHVVLCIGSASPGYLRLAGSSRVDAAGVVPRQTLHHVRVHIGCVLRLLRLDIPDFHLGRGGGQHAVSGWVPEDVSRFSTMSGETSNGLEVLGLDVAIPCV